MKYLKLIGILGCLVSWPVPALIPVEGLILGEADPSLQEDPLKLVFSGPDVVGLPVDKKLKEYQRFYTEGLELSQSCQQLNQLSYSTPVQEAQAKRSVVASLQLIGLDATIKGIGAWARKLELSSTEFERLKGNLVTNYCSKNLTVLSVRNVERALSHYYENPENGMIPSYEDSPFASKAMKEMTEKHDSRKREFNQLLRAFRSFCSWGQDVDDYRMLPPYLNNPFIQGLVLRRLTTPTDGLSSKVVCQNLVCRQVSDREFNNNFPLSVGSTGLKTDLNKLYCSHFRFTDYRPQKTIPEVAAWMKASELESPILETNFFISLLSGMPDLFLATEKYEDVALLAKSSIDDRWQAWARKVLDNFSRELLFEESLKVKPKTRVELTKTGPTPFRVDFTVTLGEIDRLMDYSDKLGTEFELKIPKNYLRSLRVKWNDMANRLAIDEQQDFFAENARTIGHYLKPKEVLFQQKMWNEDFSRLVATELLQQVLRYEGKLFENYKEEMISIPVTFSYGLFALGYLHYRSDVAKGRLRAN